MNRKLFLGIISAFVWVICAGRAPSKAIVVTPTEPQIHEALQKGQEAAEARIPPAKLYEHFGGNGGLEPQGFLMTRLSGLTVMAAHFALRGERPSREDIQRILNESELQVIVTLLGSSPTFANNSYLLLRQGDRFIKPIRVRVDARASRSPVWPDQPGYQAKLVASFSYGSFDPVAPTEILVFPGEGGEIAFRLNFSDVP